MEVVHKALKLLIIMGLLVVPLASWTDPVQQAYKLVAEGQDALNQGKTSKAEMAFRTALGLFPGWYKPMLGMAVVVMQRGEAPEAAVKWAKKAVVLEPDRWEAHLILARVLEAADRAETAVLHYVKAFQLAGSHRDMVRDFACPMMVRLKKFSDARTIGCVFKN